MAPAGGLGGKKIAARTGIGSPERTFSLMDQVFPPETRQHLRAARKEQLLAFRSLLDKWIARMDEEKATPRREAIRVE